MVIRREEAMEYVMIDISRRPTQAIWRGNEIEPMQVIVMSSDPVKIVVDPAVFPLGAWGGHPGAWKGPDELNLTRFSDCANERKSDGFRKEGLGPLLSRSLVLRKKQKFKWKQNAADLDLLSLRKVCDELGRVVKGIGVQKKKWFVAVES
ncbi:hypothetical protein TNCV_2921101 [Trichonephila clavipes]|nr:hypothetical protein TNCV_2921101 [Trichonephila clavipes]